MDRQESIRVLNVIASVDPAYGGPVQGLRNSASIYQNQGIETEVVSLDMPDSPHLAAFPFKVHAIGHWFKRYPYTPKLAKWIIENAHRYDAAIVHGLWNHASASGGRALSRAGLPYVVFAHGMMDPWFRTAYPTKHLAKQIYWWLWQGRVLSKAKAVLFTAEDEQKLAKGEFLGHAYKGQVIAYGASSADIDETANGPSAFRAAVPSLGLSPYLLFISRIHPKKGVDILIEAFSAISADQPDLHLVVAGPDQSGLVAGLSERAIELGIASRVHFPGMLTGAAKWGAFIGAEAFVLPSHQENFGIVVAEALGVGCPTIITDKINIWREIEREGAGIISSDTVEGFTAALKKWACLDQGSRQKLVTGSKLCYQDNFLPETAANALAAKLKDIARG